MSLTLSPAKARYLERVINALSDLSEDDRDEVIQDLEAHLAELSETDLDRVLGTPDSFVAEFRASAGLDVERRGRLATARDHLLDWENRMTDSDTWRHVSRVWIAMRPIWIWTRGWLAVSLFSLFTSYGTETFRVFPIPSVGFSSSRGLLAVSVATFVSVFLARYPLRSGWGFLSTLYTTVVALMLATSLLNPTPLGTTGPGFEEVVPQGLVTEGWEPVQNIYAFDTEGNPVEVLLYDQDGRPLLNLPSYTYEQAEYLPQEERYPTDYGEVEFQRDDLGRIIPNLYPLQTWEYSDFGELMPSLPPSLGFPASPEPAGHGTQETSVATTIATADMN